MPTFVRQLAEDLLEDHRGIPDLKVSIELCESFLRVLRKRIYQDGEVLLDEFGKFTVVTHAGGIKADPKTGIKYQTTPRSVLKFKASDGMVDLLNQGRIARKRPPA